MKKALQLFGLVVVVALLFGGGVIAGRHWQARTPKYPPVSSELTLDSMNRPASLKQVVVGPDGQSVLHGEQFKWEWNDQPIGFVVQREIYVSGSLEGFASWGVTSLIMTPSKPIDPAELTKYPGER